MMYLQTTNFSSNLERIGVTDIGRRSEKVLAAAVLGTGVTRAVFHEEGGVQVCNMVLKRTVTTGVNSIAQCLKTQYGIESCPAVKHNSLPTLRVGSCKKCRSAHLVGYNAVFIYSAVSATSRENLIL